MSMPIALNEPLNLLQRLCEELEYCELLEDAGKAADPVDRMVFIAGGSSLYEPNEYTN